MRKDVYLRNQSAKHVETVKEIEQQLKYKESVFDMYNNREKNPTIQKKIQSTKLLREANMHYQSVNLDDLKRRRETKLGDLEEQERRKAAAAQERVAQREREREEQLRERRLRESGVRQANASGAEQTRLELEQRQAQGEERRKQLEADRREHQRL